MHRFNRIASAVLVINLAVVAWAGCASHQRAILRTSHNDSVTATIMQREHGWTDAMRRHDMAALDDIMAAEFRLTFVDVPPGRPGKPEVPRELWLENLKQMTFGPIEMIGMHVTMQGESVAAVRMRMVLHDWKWGEQVIPPNYDLTDIWVLRDGRWQVVNRISEPLDPPMGPPPVGTE